MQEEKAPGKTAVHILNAADAESNAADKLPRKVA